MAISQFKATTADLLTSIKSRALIPTSQSTYTAAQILSLADEELQTGILPLIMATQEEYLTAFKDYAVGTTNYFIPDRAIGGKLREVAQVVNGKEYNVPRVELEDLPDDNAFSFYLRGNEVCFTATPTSTIRMYYHQRPNHLIETSACGLVAAVGAAAVDLSAVPSTFTTSLTYDVVRATPPSKLRDMDVTISSIASLTVNFGTLPSVAVGDYFCIAGQSPVVQCPYEFIPVLAQRVAVKILEGVGDDGALQAAQTKLMELERSAMTLISPRVDGQVKKITNRSSSIRNPRNRYGRG